MKIKIINFLLVTVFAIGILRAGNLVLRELEHPNTCPTLLGIPACYIILACFIIPFISHFYNRNNIIYFVFTGFAFIVALVASIMQFTNTGACPKTENGTPMCYYSLLLFTSLIVIKVLHSKRLKQMSLEGGNY